MAQARSHCALRFVLQRSTTIGALTLRGFPSDGLEKHFQSRVVADLLRLLGLRPRSMALWEATVVTSIATITSRRLESYASAAGAGSGFVLPFGVPRPCPQRCIH